MCTRGVVGFMCIGVFLFFKFSPAQCDLRYYRPLRVLLDKASDIYITLTE
jgi:hypothetical protein